MRKRRKYPRTSRQKFLFLKKEKKNRWGQKLEHLVRNLKLTVGPILFTTWTEQRKSLIKDKVSLKTATKRYVIDQKRLKTH